MERYLNKQIHENTRHSFLLWKDFRVQLIKDQIKQKWLARHKKEKSVNLQQPFNLLLLNLKEEKPSITPIP